MILRLILVCKQEAKEIVPGVVGPDEFIVFQHELCLYQSEATKQKTAHQVASIIVKVPDNLAKAINRVLAYACSFERLYNSEHFVIRIAEVKPYHADSMPEFQWDPQGAPQHGSLHHTEQTIYLVRKNNLEYLRLSQYEILNTEIRSLLFKHAYGYDLALLDFGKLQALQSGQSLKLRQPHAFTKALSRPSQIPGAQLIREKTAGLNFIFRDFGIIRVKILDVVLQKREAGSMD